MVTTTALTDRTAGREGAQAQDAQFSLCNEILNSIQAAHSPCRPKSESMPFRLIS